MRASVCANSNCLNRGVHPAQVCQNCAKTLFVLSVGDSLEREADSQVVPVIKAPGLRVFSPLVSQRVAAPPSNSSTAKAAKFSPQAAINFVR